MRIASILFVSCFVFSQGQECERICTLIPGACSSKGSYCKGGHACHDIFWLSEGVLCNHAVPGCDGKKPLLCSDAAAIVESRNARSVQGPGQAGPPRVSQSSSRVEPASTPKKSSAVSPPEQAPIPGSGVKGITNLGATCHLGAVLQVLLHSPAIRRALSEDRENDMLLEINDVYRHFTLLARAMYDDSVADALDPAGLFGALRAFNGGAGFVYNKAADAHETLTVLLNGLAESSGRLASVTQLATRGYSTCMTCSNTEINPRASSSIQLVHIVDTSKPCHLNELLTAHFAPQSLSKYCPSCDHSSEVLVFPEIVQTPEVLVITLPRYMTGEDAKIMTSVEIPFELNLREVAAMAPSQRSEYRLTGIVRHKKDHFVADYWNAEMGSWVHTDDRRVKTMAGHPGNSGHEPFILFFERI